MGNGTELYTAPESANQPGIKQQIIEIIENMFEGELRDGRVLSGDNGNDDMVQPQDDGDDEDDGVPKEVLLNNDNNDEEWRFFQEEGISLH